MEINRKIYFATFALICLLIVVAWKAPGYLQQKPVDDEEIAYNKERAVNKVLAYFDMIKDGQVSEAFDSIPIFYKEEYSDIMEMLKISWSNPSPFEIEILEVNKVNNELYQVIVFATHITEEMYDNIHTTSDMYALFMNHEWVLVLNPHNVPDQYRENLVIKRWHPDVVFPDEVVILG